MARPARLFREFSFTRRRLHSSEPQQAVAHRSRSFGSYSAPQLLADLTAEEREEMLGWLLPEYVRSMVIRIRKEDAQARRDRSAWGRVKVPVPDGLYGNSATKREPPR